MSCYSYRNKRSNLEIFADPIKMLNSIKIFALVFVLLAKFTMSFIGADLGGICKVKASVHSTKEGSDFHSELCFTDESETKTESKDQGSDTYHLFFDSFSIGNIESSCLQAAYSYFRLNSYPSEKRFLLFGNFRL